ncbi:orotidine-5'-phosphate decarboxylase [Paramagnetospirillum kuznetsovii]|uniref:Orotidine 5'-phosphate decarboxylase n=1 Tax=Paramagnetospirillum kuznetsovii TaxID=2053833 RepID=A0A364NX55_9PROT|nr:orotidine-5'-phosphate decarboxylase [Paramagnetospirillum kuznetsovii]RAU21626.1 orotidine-5'-phosphate decarboxylase [Paramagnetospirillum kuznetsovii]
MTASNPVFVALDTTEQSKAAALARTLIGQVGGFKLGLEYFIANGPEGMAAVSELGMPLFVDLKLHDIPNTVAAAMRGVVRLKAAITTIHASGGAAMIRAAADAAKDEAAKLGLAPPAVVAVTILTSLDQAGAEAVGFSGAVLDQVKRLAALAQDSGADGIVCSPLEVDAVRALCGPDFKLVIPGIRPAWSETGDQKRFLTPAEARAKGADVLVIGRPITGAADPAEAAGRIKTELGLAP